jgi:hypothetical protein
MAEFIEVFAREAVSDEEAATRVSLAVLFPNE